MITICSFSMLSFIFWFYFLKFKRVLKLSGSFFLQLHHCRISDQKGNMSAWFNLFAELDPLQNPDALGKKTEEGNKEKPEGGAC